MEPRTLNVQSGSALTRANDGLVRAANIRSDSELMVHSESFGNDRVIYSMDIDFHEIVPTMDSIVCEVKRLFVYIRYLSCAMDS